MGREIKFRTWHIAEKRMIHGYMATAVSCFTQGFAYTKNEVELMQFTGLTDKNGREIYEGDIISDDDTFRWKVFWEDGAFHAKGGEFGLQEHLIEFHPDFCEVIGNIYEHPELTS